MTATTQIVEYSQTEAALATLREKYATTVYDVTTPKGMQLARTDRAEIRAYRTSLEAKRQELKAPVLERGRLLDSEAKRITAELLALEEPIDAVIKAEEQRRAAEKAAAEEAERQRLAEIQEHISAIRNAPVQFASASSEDIDAYMLEMANLEITLDDYAELTGEAIQAKQQTLDKLTELHAAALAREAEQERIKAEREELEKLRAEQAERERIAAAERAEAEAKAKAEQDRIAAEQAAQQAELDRQRQEFEQQQAAAAKAEQDKRDAEAKAERELAERKLYETFLQEGPPAEELVKFIADEYLVDHADAARWLASHDFAALAEQLKAA